MEIPFQKHVMKLWESWNLRSFILFSLSLQTFLILFAPLRKRTSNKFPLALIWSAYLLADWAANFSVGIISNAQGRAVTPVSEESADILAFWGPFLLIHLGGPDTITAYSLEDNELWIRHLLGLLLQVFATVYVFLQSLPKNRLWLPTLFLFLAGLIKYAERTRALYQASMERFRESMLTDPDPGPNYAKLMEEYAAKKEAGLPTKIKILAEPDKETADANIAVQEGRLNEIEVVQHAYRFFKTFRGLIVDLIFSFRERNQSRNFFLERSAKDAFRVIEVELNFIYEVLFTKVEVVHCLPGYIFRALSFGSLMAAMVLFYNEKKHGFHKADIKITYVLFIGAVALDLIALVMVIISDWTVAALRKRGPRTIVNISKFLTRLCPEVFHRRWSKSLSTYNLIDYCVKQRLKKFNYTSNYFSIVYIKDVIKKGYYLVSDYTGLAGFLEQFVPREPFTDNLRNFIFKELHKKSNIAEHSETAKEICAARGNWILRYNGCNDLLQWIDGVDYDESLLLWHIATDLCFYTDKPDNNTDQQNKKFSKLLSDYMLYLLIMQPALMSAVAGIGQIRFRDTCAEAIKFFRRGELTKGTERVDACKKILGVNTDVKPTDIKGDRSKSVLFDACMLAKKLNDLDDKKLNKWKIMSKVWVELMSYAATNCRANTHAQQVSKGGELVTFVWLLMAHFGLGEQFQIKEGHARAKIIVGK